MTSHDTDYDVIVVGGRVAGAGTALLLARMGWRVAVVDRARRGSDTLSTHALMRPAVRQLDRWGLLDAVIAAGTPGQDRTVFHYGDDRVELDASQRLYAPRRTVLDPIVVAAAEDHGADVRFGIDVRGLLRDDAGRVTGIAGRDGAGGRVEMTARVTVGADGRASLVARDAGAIVTHRGTTAAAAMYGYWTGVPAAGFEWCFRPGRSAGLIPTNDGQVCVFIAIPRPRFAGELRHDPEAGVHRVLAETSPTVAARVSAGRRVSPVRGFAGLPGWLRRPWGRGWALVGDAGYFKDPATAHGISDAFRDAELLARALDDHLRVDGWSAEPLAQYERERDRLSLPLFAVTNAIASFAWDLADVQRHHLAMSDAITDEVDALDALGPVATPCLVA